MSEKDMKIICNYCYAGNSEIDHVSVPGSVSEVGVGAFSDCVNLETVELHEGVKRLRKEVFSGCCSLKAINIPESVQSIGEWAFRGCRSLKELKIPNSVVEICEESFLDCPNLTIAAEEDSYAAGYAERTGIPLKKICVEKMK